MEKLQLVSCIVLGIIAAVILSLSILISLVV